MQQSLLSHIASNFISEYENVANSSIAYLLNKYPSARLALKALVGKDKNIPTYYHTELATKSNGRFDIAGLDEKGKVSLVIEGKFWASLTDNQPVNYLQELGNGGVLLFLAPEKRIVSLQMEIESRLNGKQDSRIQLSSWQSFLSLIEIENNKAHEPNLASDLIQIKELCLKMDVEGMPPISKSDLDPVHARICTQFASLIPECNTLLRSWGHANFKGSRTTSSQYGHGFYFSAFNFGCALDFSTYEWFTEKSQTPFWLTIQTSDWEKDYKLHHFLEKYNQNHAYDTDCASMYAITLQTGMDKDAAINHIVNETKKVLTFLNDSIS